MCINVHYFILISLESSLTLEHLNEFRTVLRHFINFQQKQKFDRILKIRQDQVNLPIFQFKEHILIGVRDHQVILIAGDTGCGKSTQVSSLIIYCYISII